LAHPVLILVAVVVVVVVVVVAVTFINDKSHVVSVCSAFCVELMDRSAADLHDMFTRTYGQLYQQNAHIFTSLFADLRSYYFGTDLDLGTAMDSFFDTLSLRMFRLLNAQYAFDGDYLECVRKSIRSLTPFGEVPQKLGVQLKRSLVAARTFHQGLMIGRQVVDALAMVSRASLVTCAAAVVLVIMSFSLTHGWTNYVENHTRPWLH